MSNLIKVDHKEFGLEEVKANEITSGLNQILSERKVLEQSYSEVILMEITKENLSKFRELRLKIRDNRTKGIQNWHKVNKEFYLRGGQFVDAIKSKEIEVNQRMENALEENENFFERQEAERIEKLKTERILECEPYAEFIPFGIDLGSLTSEAYNSIFNGAKLQFEAKQEAERKAEQERIEAERREVKHNERKQILVQYNDFINPSNSDRDWGSFDEDTFSNYVNSLKKRKVEHDNQIEAQRIENEKLKAEAEAREKQIKADNAERERLAELERKKQAEIQAKKDAEQAEKLKAEQLAKQKLEAELKAKRDAEIQVEKERLEAEQKAKQEAEKLAKAPIKKQLNIWVDNFEIPLPTNPNEITLEIAKKFNAFKKWAKEQVESI